MFKNLVQAILCGVGMYFIGTSDNVELAAYLMVIVAVVAAFESSRFLSATEVGITTLGIVFVMKGWWIAAMVLLAILIAENLAFVLAPVKLWLMKVDERGGG
jgi:hypothetical protein